MSQRMMARDDPSRDELGTTKTAAPGCLGDEAGDLGGIDSTGGSMRQYAAAVRGSAKWVSLERAVLSLGAYQRRGSLFV